jgi:chromosome segregation ATPase
MSTPEGTPTPESTPGDTSAEDEAAQRALADAAAQEADDDGDDDGDDKFDEQRARRKIDKANREAKSLRERIKALEPLAAEAEKTRKGQQTEAQRLTEEKASLEVELAELRTANIRREAAETAGLPAKFVKYINAADPAEALAQAKELAKEFKSANNEGGTTGKPDYRQGARGASNSGSTATPDDLLRQMAGRGR